MQSLWLSSARSRQGLEIFACSAWPAMNGANVYDSSLMNPYAFTDAELLLHVSPRDCIHRAGLQSAASGLRNSQLPLSDLLPGSHSGGLAALASLLDAGEATSVERPFPLPSEAVSRSRCSPSSPPCLAPPSYGPEPMATPNGSETQPPEVQFADSSDMLEDPADHREKNRVAQKK